jgi:hypothetical protein
MRWRVQQNCFQGWTPETELQPVRLVMLLLLAVGSFALAVLCFRLLGSVTGGSSTLLWAGLCFSPPLGLLLWVLDERRRPARAGAPVLQKTDLEGGAVDESPETELAEAHLKISRDVA